MGSRGVVSPDYSKILFLTMNRLGDKITLENEKLHYGPEPANTYVHVLTLLLCVVPLKLMRLLKGVKKSICTGISRIGDYVPKDVKSSRAFIWEYSYACS